MKLSDRIFMSIQSLLKRKLRTLLTILGVVIGVASIVVMVALGQGMQQKAMAQIEQFGGMKVITVKEGDTSSSGSSTDNKKTKQNELALKLTDETVENLKKLDNVSIVSPVLNFQCILKSGQYEDSVWDGEAMTLEAMEENKWKFSEGSLPKEGEPLKFVYGNMLLQDFTNSSGKSYFDTGKLPDIDLMNDTVFTIFDVDAYNESKSSSSAKGTGDNTAASDTADSGSTGSKAAPKKYIIPAAGVLYGKDENDFQSYSFTVYCDIDALMAEYKKVFRNKAIPGQPVRSNGTPYKQIFYTSIYVKVDDVNNVETVQKTINDMGYKTESQTEWVKQTQEQSRSMQAMLGGVGAVSLLVAAIGIANTMMMSIYERTKEIGIMKVLGCDLKDIQSLFLIEAAFIGFAGGIAGIVLSYLVSFIINMVAGAGTAVIPLWLIPAAMVFAVFVGMAAGFMPSKRAMQLSPLAAIRNE